MRRTVACLLIAAAIAGLALANDRPTPAPAPPAGEHDFGAKVVLAVIRPSDGRGAASVVLEKARVTRLGDRYFLVGTHAADIGPEFKGYGGLKMWAALSEVNQVVEFDSVEAVREAYRNRRNPGAGD